MKKKDNLKRFSPKAISILAVISVLIIVMLLPSCGKKGDLLKFQGTDLEYYEFVYEDTTCNTDCFREYIVISNGFTLTKIEAKRDGQKTTEVSLGTIDTNAAEEVIGYTESIMAGYKTNGIMCSECRLYHVFYGDNRITRVFSDYGDNTPESIKGIEKQTQLALKDIKESEPFFLHLVFKKVNKDSIDYHFFGDGTVLKEVFGINNGELKSHMIYRIDGSELRMLKDSVNDNFFIPSSNNLHDCEKNDLEWGYIEIKDKENYGLSFTCGTGNSAADTIFLDLFKKTGGR
jgi:hypothetical protein